MMRRNTHSTFVSERSSADRDQNSNYRRDVNRRGLLHTPEKNPAPRQHTTRGRENSTDSPRPSPTKFPQPFFLPLRSRTRHRHRTMAIETYSSFISDDFTEPLPWPAPTLANSIWDNFSLKGKVAVITGGARGIGFAVAKCYAQAGANIAIVDFQIELATESAKKLAAEYGVKCGSYFVDVSKCEAVEEAVQTIESDFGTIDIFVANAGIIWIDGGILNESVKQSGPEKWRRLIDVDLNAVYYCAKAVGAIFKAKGKGSFIITASISGHIANVPNYQTCYNVAKAGCLHLGRSLAVEWAGFARVNTVSPGYIDSGLSDALPTEVRAKWWSLIPMGREGLPEELVGAYLYLASDASSYTTGSDIRVDGGYCSV